MSDAIDNVPAIFSIDLSKRWRKLGTLYSVYNGPHLPTRKSQMLEHLRTGEDVWSAPLGCRSVGFSFVERASFANLYVI